MHTNIDFAEVISEDLFFGAGSPVMRKLRMQAELLAKLNVPVLILGESGSGKEIVAKLIHKLSVRSECRFVKVNCAALPSDLLERELFGYERGAFTFAMRTGKGKFELCHNGTIVLDEIGDMPLALQAKLLHMLQGKQFFRLGGDTAISANVRILAAANVNVEKALLETRLHEDLYYRLSAFTVQVPPLRERKEEIPLLVGHLMQQMARHYGMRPRAVSPTFLEACQSYSWPGSLGELENVVKHYLVMGDEFLERGGLGATPGALTDEAAWQSSFDESYPTNANACHREPGDLKSMLRSVKGEVEKSAIASALEKTHWNRKAAAHDLGISYRGLLYKIQAYQLVRPGSRIAMLVSSSAWKPSGHGQ